MQIYQTRGGDIPLPPARENKNVSKKKAAKTAASRKHRKKGLAELLVTGAILITAAAIAASLFFYFRPFTPQDVVNAGKHLAASVSGHITEGLDILWEQGIGRLFSRTDAPSSASLAEGSPRSPGGEKDQDTGNIVPFLDHTTDLGQASDFSAEPVYRAKEDSIFTFMLDTALGPMLYYSQGDIRWKDYLYGGQDPISSYGCGPVCVAMIINSFSPTGIDPIGMADWSAANGGYARHGGSYHRLIPDSLSAFGLQVESVTDRSVEHVSELLRTNHILVALMGRGSLTQNGHFIIIAQLCANGNVYIADPANYENCTKEWELQLLMDELKEANDSGAPLWAVSVPALTK